MLTAIRNAIRRRFVPRDFSKWIHVQPDHYDPEIVHLGVQGKPTRDEDLQCEECSSQYDWLYPLGTLMGDEVSWEIIRCHRCLAQQWIANPSAWRRVRRSEKF